MATMRGGDVNAVGIRELKNRLTHYVRLAKQGAEIVITEHGRPVALMQSLQDVRSPQTQEVQLAKLAAQGRLILPRGPAIRVKRVRLKGSSLARTITEGRDETT
ncbi:MAG: type II toxin-antitoxin system Phd/YefM family antitoxin [Nitrospirales bacterium]|nr:type II toxin-antitoxin system Phd/YefM family antitoxin [Nitrospirales bacterium]